MPAPVRIRRGADEKTDRRSMPLHRCAIQAGPEKDMRPQGPHVQFENPEADFGMARWW